MHSRQLAIAKTNPKQINHAKGKTLKEQYSLGLGAIDIGGDGMSCLVDLFQKKLYFGFISRKLLWLLLNNPRDCTVAKG